jgi:hypothetical protein
VKPKYIECSSFVAVFTPHFQAQVCARNAGLFSEEDIPLEKLWDCGIADECCGVAFGGGFLYYKCKWNTSRVRWELELISYTPGNFFHTAKLKFAHKICLESN